MFKKMRLFLAVLLLAGAPSAFSVRFSSKREAGITIISLINEATSLPTQAVCEEIKVCTDDQDFVVRIPKSYLDEMGLVLRITNVLPVTFFLFKVAAHLDDDEVFLDDLRIEDR